MKMMNAAVFTGPGRIVLGRKPLPSAGPGEAVIKVTLTTICGTDVHILKGEYPVADGLTIGHEPVGTIAELGAGVTGYRIGQCYTCLDGHQAQCGGHAMGGWRFGNAIDGCQAEYVKVPAAMANLAQIPDDLSDEQVLMCPDIMSTGFGGAENGGIRIGDTVAIFAQGPIGLCATAGARLRGASRIIAVDTVPERLAMARQLGADHTIDYRKTEPVEEILRLTNGAGVDVAIEALGTQQTFESCLRALKPGGTLSSLGVYSGKLGLPVDAFAAGLGDHKLITTLCPGGKERMRRLMNVVASQRLDLRPLITHRFRLEHIEAAYELFANQRDGVLKVAITP
jgi:alcohol dehydrogenase